MLAGVPFAHGQDAEQGAILEEVVVTAQKQQENLQAVPMRRSSTSCASPT
jgi:hypothetical protein